MLIPSAANTNRVLFEMEEKSWKGELTYVCDGDTVFVSNRCIRLWGIDAPEKGCKGFGASQRALTRIALDKTVTVIPIAIDKYTRLVALLYVNSLCVNKWMKKNGYAINGFGGKW